jgi:hypothetical protein
LRAGSVALFGMYGSVSEAISIDLANGLLFTSFAVTWAGARVFDGRGPQPTSQVVFSGMMGEATEVRVVWNIERMTEGGGGGHLVDPNEAEPAAA